jgi:short-subunit dehydrogenase
LLTAVRLAAQGHFVWATMRDLSKRRALEDELNKRNVLAFIRELDVTRPSSIKKVVEEIHKTHYHIDVLVNNAGYGIGGFFEDLNEEELRAQMETNFFGVQAVCREVIPLMRSRKQGKIINISSIAGRIATPCLGAYNASKWALEAFSESLYYEMSLFGISVVLVEPGSYPTNIFTQNAHYAKNFDNPQGPYFTYNQKIRDLAQRGIRKLQKDPDDVAKLIENIIDTPRPRLRYISDFSSWVRVMAQKILPTTLTAYIFRRFVYADK